MKLSFRQGIARYQTDVLSTPAFLQLSSDGTFINLSVSPDPTIVVFAHRSSNYIFEELKSVQNAWGGFSGTIVTYLYWDINILTGVVTRGTTSVHPIYSNIAPSTPVIDQHWFNTTETVMMVWNSVKWIEKIRVFAGFVSSGSLIRSYSLGSQAGITGDFEGGNIILDVFNKPLRQSDGTFVTTVSSLVIVNGAANSVRFESQLMAGMASEPIPKFSLVQVREGRKIILAKYTDWTSRIAGIVLEDLYTNEVGTIITDGVVRNEQWRFSTSEVNRPIFCGPFGEITTIPPKRGVLQSAGFVYDTDSIFMNITMPIILDDVRVIGVSPSPSPYPGPIPSPSPTPAPSPTSPSPAPSPEPIIQDVFTNLGIVLNGPAQMTRGESIKIYVTVTNDGFRTATDVQRIITIPDLSGQPVVISETPIGTIVSRDTNRTIVSMPIISYLPSSKSYGPFVFTITAPIRSGPLVISGVVLSPEIDSAPNDNITQIAIEVKA